MARRKLPESFEVIEEIAQRAAAGDSAAYKELGQINRHLARVANDRLRALEKKHMTETNAYGFAEKASRVTGTSGAKPRFSEAVKGSEEELLRKAEDAYKFLNFSASTISGSRHQVDAMVKGLEEQGYKIDNKRDFVDFMFSPAWNEMKRIYGTTNVRRNPEGKVVSKTTGAMTQLQDALQKGASLRELMNAYDELEENKKQFENVGWAKFNLIDRWIDDANDKNTRKKRRKR